HLVGADDALVVVHRELPLGAALARLAGLAFLARAARRTAAARRVRLRDRGRVVVGARGSCGHRRRPTGRAAALDVPHRQRAGRALLALVPALARALLALLAREHVLGLVLGAVVRSRRAFLLLQSRRFGLLELMDLLVLAADLLAARVVALLRRRLLALLD